MAWGLFAGVQAALAQPAPYDLDKFKPVLDDSKLQAPTSSPALIAQGDFAGKSNAYFFLDATGEGLVFMVSGDGMRSELRQETGDWRTSTSTERALGARVKVPLPETDSLNQFTFMQVLGGDADFGRPLLRVTWRRERNGLEDHLWAVVRTPEDFEQPISDGNLDSLTVDLGPRPAGFFDAMVLVKDNRLRVLIEGETKVDTDVSYWAGLDSYFKAGVYLQDPGTASAVFDQLGYTRLVPEPGALLLLTGLAGLVLTRYRSQRLLDPCVETSR